MALTDIITKIKEDAAAEASRLQNDAEEEARTILKEAKEKADEILDEGKEAAQLAGKETHDRTMSAAAHTAKFATQGFHASLIERTFDEVEKALKDMPKAAYKDFVTKRAASLPQKEGVLTVAKERKDETLEVLKSAGVDTKDAKEAPLLGGFILETKTAEYDHSLKEVLRLTRERGAGDVAHILFGTN